MRNEKKLITCHLLNGNFPDGGAKRKGRPTTMRGPLILLSPAKTLNFDAALSAAISSAAPTQPRLPKQTAELAGSLAKLSMPQVKSLMSLSDALATLNHERFSTFEAQPTRMAIGAFEGMAYKGLDAPSLAAEPLGYMQSHLRILCGLYGVLRPYDEIRPYRLEMSTKLKVGDSANLYAYWGSSLTSTLDAEEPEWVLNIASQEYSKAIKFDAMRAPVVTAAFPGPAVHAKHARGEMARFCAEQRVSRPEELKAFRGANDMWSFVADRSTAETYTFERGAKGGAKGGGKGGAKGGAGAVAKQDGKRKEVEEAEAGDALAAASGSSSRRRKTK